MRESGRKVLALIPLNLDNSLFQWKSGKATEVLSRKAGDFTGWNVPGFDMEIAMEPLIRALRADEAGREAPPPRRL